MSSGRSVVVTPAHAGLVHDPQSRLVGVRAEAGPVTPADRPTGTGQDVREHCPTCICGRRAPVQGERHSSRGDKPPGSVTWEEYLEAYTAYAARFGRSQSPERLAERAGFGYWEITDLLGHEPTTWSVR